MRLAIFCLITLLIPSTGAWAQSTGQIVGSVTSMTGAPLAGAAVNVRGTTRSAMTDADGTYTITAVPAGTHQVRVTRIGYGEETRRVTVAAGEMSTVDFQLAAGAVQLEGVTVNVGYGTEQREKLTGAVAVVGTEELTERPVANVSEALQGLAPGLTVKDVGGEPGVAGTDIKIRGIGTLGNANPLVLVDGIEGDLDDVDANDIESISVLKDAASAAIYGSRAANGVILVTTKRGRQTGDLRLSYGGFYGVQNLTALPELAGPGDWLGLINETYTNSGQPPKFSDEYIQNTVNGVDPLLYPWTDWYDVMYDPAPIQDHSVRLSGGNDLATFALSLNYLDQEGMTINTGANRYGMRLNTDWNLSERLTGDVALALRRASREAPVLLDWGLRRMLHGTDPMTVAKFPNGAYGWSEKNRNALAFLEAGGLTKAEETEGTVNAQLSYDILDGLSLRTKAAVEYGVSDREDFREDRVFYNYFEPDRIQRHLTPNQLDIRSSNREETTLQALLDYDKLLGDHGVSALLGYEQISNDFEWVFARRQGFYNNDLREIGAGDPSRDETGGSSSAWRLRSGFGRVGYNYQGRYLLQASARYDGSSRFAEGNRYGFFPSFSAAWRISEEPFFNVGFLDELKLRGSWGRLGNQEIGLYRYFSSIALGQGYPFGGQLVQGAAQTVLANDEISWETTETANLGLDVAFFDNRLAFTGDVYRKNTDGILLTLPISSVIGLRPPVQNAGVVRNTGWEASLSWQDAVGEFNYAFDFNLSDVRNEVVDLAGTGPFIGEREYGGRYYIIQEGQPIGAIYGYEADGLFQSQEEVQSHAKQDPRTGPGDIRYKDQNGDGIINADDRVVLGSDLPRYTLGSGFNASYKGFDASVFFHGVLKANTYINGSLQEGPVYENFVTTAWLDRWTPDNPNATMPRPRIRTNINTRPISSFWLQDASYVKLKNAQIGYTMPAPVLGRLGVERLRLYVTGNNLLQFTDLEMSLDPEVPVGRAYSYPQVRTISIGTDITF